MVRRVVLLSVCLLAGFGVIARASRTEIVPPRQPLKQFPLKAGSWSGRDYEPLTAEVLAVLGADEYLSRFYQSPSEGGVGLYIGYYESQRQGDTMHSPLNCLPGAGWQPLSKSYLTIPVTDASGAHEISVNRYVIEKGLDRQVVLYWYQSHGRVIANEYRSKVLMVYDAMRLNRSDAALVRVISPVIGPDGQERADARGVEFVKTMFPLLDAFLPS
jgi:EpsI family protein